MSPYAIFLAGLIFIVQTSSHTSIRWVNSRTVTEAQLLPAGGEMVPVVTTYVGRALHRGAWVPGKVKWSGTQFILYIAVDGVQHEKADLEVLMDQAATTSWVRMESNGAIPNHPVLGGTDPNTGEETYICRAFLEGHLLPGRMLPNSKVCHVPLHYDRPVRTFEILVNNDYAIFIGIQK